MKDSVPLMWEPRLIQNTKSFLSITFSLFKGTLFYQHLNAFFFKHSDVYDKIKLIKRLNGFLRNKVVLHPPAKYVKRCTSIRLFFSQYLSENHIPGKSVCIYSNMFVWIGVWLWSELLDCTHLPHFVWITVWSSGAQTGFLLDEDTWKDLLQEIMRTQSVKPD